MSPTFHRLALGLAAALLLALAVPEATAQARTDTQVIRSWEEPVKTADGEETRRVEIAFDYAQGTPVRRTYDTAGSLLATEAIAAQPQPSEAEIAEAEAIIEADAELAPLLAESGATIEGGFTYNPEDFEREDFAHEGFKKALAACGPSVRCLQFDLVAPSRTESVRFVVVDLATRRVVEHDLFPHLD